MVTRDGSIAPGDVENSFVLKLGMNEYTVYRLSRTVLGLGGPEKTFIRTLHLFCYNFFL